MSEASIKSKHHKYTQKKTVQHDEFSFVVLVLSNCAYAMCRTK